MGLSNFTNFLLVVFFIGIISYMVLRWNRVRPGNYICHHDFPLDISFELVKEGSYKHILGGQSEIKIGYREFDDTVYISSDIPVLKRVLANNEVRDIILEIIREHYIHGIYIEDKQIKLLTQNIGKNDKHRREELNIRYYSKVKLLRDKFKDEFDKVRVDEDVRKFSNNFQKHVHQIEAFYFSLFVTSLLFVFSFCIVDSDAYFCLNNFSLKQIFIATFGLFSSIIFIVLNMTKYSVRRHLLFAKTLYLLLPACFLSGFFFLYVLNIYWDKSEEVVSVESIRTEVTKGSKNRATYHLYIVNANNKDLEKKSHLTITGTKYNYLKNKTQVEFIVKQGYFNVPYARVKGVD